MTTTATPPATNGTNGNPTGNGSTPPPNSYPRSVEIAVQEMLYNFSTSRMDMFRRMFDPRRDLDAECGWPSSEGGFGSGLLISPDLYRTLYERFDVANRVVSLMSEECWQKPPTIFEDADKDTNTPFEQSWIDFGAMLYEGRSWYKNEQENHPVWPWLKKANRLAGIGSFGIILIGLNDGQNLETPAEGVVQFPIFNHDGSITVNIGFRDPDSHGYQPSQPDSYLADYQERALLDMQPQTVWNGRYTSDGKPIAEQRKPLPLNDNERAVINRWRQERQLILNAPKAPPRIAGRPEGFTPPNPNQPGPSQWGGMDQGPGPRFGSSPHPASVPDSLRGGPGSENNPSQSYGVFPQPGKGLPQSYPPAGLPTTQPGAGNYPPSPNQPPPPNTAQPQQPGNGANVGTMYGQIFGQGGTTSGTPQGQPRQPALGQMLPPATGSPLASGPTTKGSQGPQGGGPGTSSGKPLGASSSSPYGPGSPGNDPYNNPPPIPSTMQGPNQQGQGTPASQGPYGPGGSINGTDQQYFGVVMGPTELPSDTPAPYRGNAEEEAARLARQQAKKEFIQADKKAAAKAAQQPPPQLGPDGQPLPPDPNAPPGQPGQPQLGPDGKPLPTVPGEDGADGEPMTDQVGEEGKGQGAPQQGEAPLQAPKKPAGNPFAPKPTGNAYDPYAEDLTANAPPPQFAKKQPPPNPYQEDTEEEVSPTAPGAPLNPYAGEPTNEGNTPPPGNRDNPQRTADGPGGVPPQLPGKGPQQGGFSPTDKNGEPDKLPNGDPFATGGPQGDSEGDQQGAGGTLPYPEDGLVPGTIGGEFDPGSVKIPGMPDPNDPDEEPIKPNPNARRVTFLRVFDESLVQIVRYEWNVNNPRFGKPVMYRVTLNDPREQHSGIGLPLATVFVHWSRVIHVANTAANSSEVFATPEMRPVLNTLLDMRKVRGAAAEGYYKSCFQGLSFETHPALGGDVVLDTASLKDQYESFINGLQRVMVSAGGSWKTLAPSVVDPTSQVAVGIEAICIQKGCPVRVFKGAERGELASSQDDEDWNERKQEYQRNFCTPKIIIPLIDRLILMGVLYEPESYGVEWPEIDALGETDRTAIALQKTQALQAYIAGQVESVMPPKDFLTRILGYQDEVADAILESAQTNQENMTVPPPGQTGHPGSPPPPPPPSPFGGGGLPGQAPPGAPKPGDPPKPGAKPNPFAAGGTPKPGGPPKPGSAISPKPAIKKPNPFAPAGE